MPKRKDRDPKKVSSTYSKVGSTFRPTYLGSVCQPCLLAAWAASRARAEYLGLPEGTITNYKRWCGNKRAPGDGPFSKCPPTKVPADDRQFETWIVTNLVGGKSLLPVNDVERACMKHDLRLRRARELDPKVGVFSGDRTIAAINRELAKDFSYQAKHQSDPEGRAFATRGALLFPLIALQNDVKADVRAMAATVSLLGAAASRVGPVLKQALPVLAHYLVSRR